MLTIYSDDHRHQHGKAELNHGEMMPVVEKPERAYTILARVREVGLGEVLAPDDFGLDPILRVHSEDFVSFLKTAFDEWAAEHGEIDAFPINWVVRGLRQRCPNHIDGKIGYYAGDAGTPITRGTWKAITASANVALTGARRVAEGERSVFSLCRPPGHHASTDVYNGYCFFNNAAIAAQAMLDRGAARIAILDIDYHHGNGTQEIFYGRDDVLFVSLHADPAEEYPYYLGYADEVGTGRGEGFNLNLPLPIGTTFATYAEAMEKALGRIRDYAPDALIVSLGADTFERDPISRFKLNSDDFSRLGEMTARCGLPTLIVMEGGYAVAELGVNVANYLTAFEGAGR
jgi:acetoin utilization deacetylase AcuC-like enzyme